MRHPELFLAPALLLADYYLTLWGAQLAERGYRNHFKSASYELNPVWRDDVAKLKWFNWRHLLLAGIVTALLWWAGETDVLFDDWFFPLMFGMVLGALIPIICQHIANIYTFDFLRRNPNEITGEVTFSMRYAIVASLAHGVTVLVLLIVAAALTQAPVVYGMLLGASVLTLARFNWLRAAKRD
ncbi:MAG: hypothetical protein HC869_21545 [Rhodospirillales bacterium]|nr:hypothetical protein [Rhodospirillales bacterium]